jgi:hypothetical protein
MKRTSQQIDVTIRQHPASMPDTPYWLAIVTAARGRCYFDTSAGDQPAEQAVRLAWAEDRTAFSPYYS